MSNLLLQICCITGIIFIVVYGQILKHNLTMVTLHAGQTVFCASAQSGQQQQQKFSCWVLQELHGQFLSLPRQKQNKIFKFIIELVADLT